MTEAQAATEYRRQRLRELGKIQNCPVHELVHDIMTITGSMSLDELEAHVEACRDTAISAGQYAPLTLDDMLAMYPVCHITE